MNTKQKTLLGIFLGMFVVPEILWSPVVNFIYSIFAPQVNNSIQTWRANFLTNSSDSTNFLIVVFIQLIGLIGTLLVLRKINTNRWFKILLYLIISIFFIITGFVFYVAFSLRHGIGF